MTRISGNTPAKGQELPKLEVSYGPVERALATCSRIPEAVREAGFRSMLNNLQKLGVLGEAARVGRGAPLVYTPIELHRLLVAIELCELGLPPATTAALIANYWESKLKAICSDAERNNPAVRGGEPIDPGDDIVVYLGGVSLRTGSLKGARSPSIPNINYCKLRDLRRHIVQWMTTGPDDNAADLPPRALVVNLSARLRAFHAALVPPYMDELRTEYAAGKVKKARAARRAGGRTRRKRK
jgi:hypothetical protein